MFNIKTINSISQSGIDVILRKGCTVGPEISNPDGIIVRSADLFDMDINPELLGIARAGAGYNNIPVDKLAEQGIVVFNAPGANAEAVKELELCSMVMASRDVLGSIDFVKSIADKGDEIPKLVEKNKSCFVGPELLGKTLGVIGLGAVGALVANMAVELGMEVHGYDPFMSVDAAWVLSKDVIHEDDLGSVLACSDYISINVPYNDSTRHMFGKAQFAIMKKGVRIINESRAEVVDDDAMLEALKDGTVLRYVTDFPNEKLIGVKGVTAMPHLGACTPESEDRCAVMAANQLYDYLLNGNIKNSVNLPNASLNRMGVCRLCVLHRNVPRMITRILDYISDRNINVEHMINKPRGEYAYTIVDLSEMISDDITESIRSMSDVLRVRVL